MSCRITRMTGWVLLVSCVLSCERTSSRPAFVLATTTSIQDSGLLDHLATIFRDETAIEIRVISVGSGKALRLGAAGEADVVFSHDPMAEREFVETYKPRVYRPFMYNEFAIAGPRENPARVEPDEAVLDALRKIASTRSRFCSRSDQSGTHAREVVLWNEAKIDPRANPNYHPLGQPMGALLRSADELRCYALTDLPTFAQFSHAIDLEILNRGDTRLRNVYAVTLVSDDPDAKRFVEWLTSPEGRRAIASFFIDGKQLFFPLSEEEHQ